MTTTAEKIKAWDKQDIYELRELISELGDDPEAYGVDMSCLPTVEIPHDVNTAYPVWAMDVDGDMLVGAGDLEIMSLADYRRQIAEVVAVQYKRAGVSQ
jgi:hypothetical protein